MEYIIAIIAFIVLFPIIKRRIGLSKAAKYDRDWYNDMNG